jgi:hypothetical protein
MLGENKRLKGNEMKHGSRMADGVQRLQECDRHSEKERSHIIANSAGPIHIPVVCWEGGYL